MSPYAAIVGARFRMLLQYRSAAVAGVFTQTFFGLVRIMILSAFYQASADTQPLSFSEMVGYVWLGQAMFVLLPWSLDRDIQEAIRTGTVAYELCRPVDLYGLWYSRALASRGAPLLLRLGPMLVVAVLVLPVIGLPEWALGPPVDLAAGLLWGVSVFTGLFLSAALATLMNISLLWMLDGAGIAVLIAAVATLLGGLVIPLPLFPDWAQPLLHALPFAGLLDLPSRVYTGHIPGARAAWVLVHQMAWTATLVFIGRALLARATRRVVVQGG